MPLLFMTHLNALPIDFQRKSMYIKGNFEPNMIANKAESNY